MNYTNHKFWALAMHICEEIDVVGNWESLQYHYLVVRW